MKKPRVLLVWPGTDGAAAGNFGCPQLVTMATYARDKTGARIDIVDLYAERFFGAVDLARLFGGPDGEGYDVVGFSCYSSYDFLKVEAIAGLVRERWPAALICAGGYHASARPMDFVYDGSPFDVAVVGEGEKPLVQLIESVAGGAPLRSAVLGPDPIASLDELPPTDWSLLDRYRKIARSVGSQAQVYLSRGCPFDCAFCMERAKREVSWRPFEVDRAMDELARAHDFFDLRGMTLYISDALFGMRKGWRRELLTRLARDPLPTRKIWLLVRVDMIDEEDLDLFGDAGCALGFGLESGDPKHLATIRKAGRLDTYLDTMRAIAAHAREKNVPFGANVIVGHPGETEATMRASAAYLSELFLDPKGTAGFLSVDPFRLYPGSPIDDERGAWEARFGTTFHRPAWWKDGDQEFLSEWVDPSAELDYRRRAALTQALFAPILHGIRENFRLGPGRRAADPARDYFERAIEDQIDNTKEPYRLHFVGRYYAWNRYLGRSALAREQLADDEDARLLCRAVRAHALDAMGRERELSPPLREALLEIPRERFVPLEDVVESTRDVAVALDGSGEATISAMHAYARSFTLARIGPGARVLDLGGGTGYGAAILARLVGERGRVVTVEIDPKLSALARQLLPDQVEVIAADALAPDTIERAGGPFDAIVVGFADVLEALEPLSATLVPGGVLVAPIVVGEAEQRLARATWSGARLDVELFDVVRYVVRRTAAPAREPAPSPARGSSPDPTGQRGKRLPVLSSGTAR